MLSDACSQTGGHKERKAYADDLRQIIYCLKYPQTGYDRFWEAAKDIEIFNKIQYWHKCVFHKIRKSRKEWFSYIGNPETYGRKSCLWALSADDETWNNDINIRCHNADQINQNISRHWRPCCSHKTASRKHQSIKDNVNDQELNLFFKEKKTAGNTENALRHKA